MDDGRRLFQVQEVFPEDEVEQGRLSYRLVLMHRALLRQMSLEGYVQVSAVSTSLAAAPWGLAAPAPSWWQRLLRVQPRATGTPHYTARLAVFAVPIDAS